MNTTGPCDMSLEFNGTVYPTIEDVKRRFRVAEKTVRKLIDNGVLPAPKVVTVGTRTFRHFTDEWMAEFSKYLDGKKAPDS